MYYHVTITGYKQVVKTGLPEGYGDNPNLEGNGCWYGYKKAVYHSNNQPFSMMKAGGLLLGGC